MIQIIALIVVLGVLLAVMRPRPDFVIDVGDKDVRFEGAIPASARPRISDFFANDAASVAKVTVRGTRRRDGSVALKFRGKLTPGERQQIRNFLNVVL